MSLLDMSEYILTCLVGAEVGDQKMKHIQNDAQFLIGIDLVFAGSRSVLDG